MNTKNFEDVGAVAIGRNEGERLRACLGSLVGQVRSVVYVDSGSTDGSVEFARELGVLVVELDMTVPFTMARARNAGWRALLEGSPGLEFVQFVDGDCEVVESWIGVARTTLVEMREFAVVCGRRRERFPEASRYNRFCDIEWNSPVGEAKACGGDFLVRTAVLKESGGMNESLIAGEEPEWCLRLRAAGHRILRIDAEMTRHDAAMLKFGQWWKRNRRAGYGSADVLWRSEGTFPSALIEGMAFAHVDKSSREWVYRLSGVFLVGSVLFTIVGMSLGTGLGAAVPAGIILGVLCSIALGLLQAVRIANSIRGREPDSGWRLRYGIFTMLGKPAQFLGQRKHLRDLRAGRVATLIEYK